MAVTATPIFAQTPKCAGASTGTTASTSAYAPVDNQTTLITAGANGSKLFSITVCPTGTTAACAVVVVVQPGGSGTKFIFDTFTIAAYTSSNTAPPTPITHTYDNFMLSASTVVQVSVTTNPTNALYCTAEYADY